MHTILHKSVVIQGYSMYMYTLQWILAELPTILDSCSPVPQVIYMGWLVMGGGEPQSGGLNKVLWAYVCKLWNDLTWGLIVLKMPQKVTKSMHYIIRQLCGELQPGCFSPIVLKTNQALVDVWQARESIHVKCWLISCWQ